MVEILEVLLGLLLLFIGLGLGSTLQISDFKATVSTKKRSFLIGMTSQFVIMPLTSYALAKMFNFSDRLSIGLVLTGCAPGGTTSNLFSYWSKGDVALSIAMSMASTIASLFMYPILILALISTSFNEDNIDFPYTSVVLSLLLLILPTAIGIFMRSRSAKWAKRLEVVGSILGGLFLLAALIWGAVDNSDEFDQSFGVWFVGFFMQLFGSFVGYTLAYFAKLSRRDCRTIALETGIQNSSLVIAMVGISFTDKEIRDDVLIFPLIYSLCYCINSPITVIFFRYYLVPRDPPEELERAELEDKERRESVAADEDISKMAPTSSLEDVTNVA